MFPDLVLAEEEGEEHEEPSVVDHPPDVDVPLHPVLVTGEPVDAFGDEHSQLHAGRHSDGVCEGEMGVCVRGGMGVCVRGEKGSVQV